MDMIFTLKFTKGHNSVKSVDGVSVLTFCNCLIMLYICTKFHKNISKAFRVIEQSQVNTEIYKGAYFCQKCRQSYRTCLLHVI